MGKKLVRPDYKCFYSSNSTRLIMCKPCNNQFWFLVRTKITGCLNNPGDFTQCWQCISILCMGILHNVLVFLY